MHYRTAIIQSIRANWLYYALGLAGAVALSLNVYVDNQPTEEPFVGLPVAIASSTLDARERASAAETLHRKTILMDAIYDEYPELAHDVHSDFEVVTLLRQWAWSHAKSVCTADASNLLDQNPNRDWLELDATGMFDLFSQDRGGVLCSGTAQALMRLYETFGYNAWIVDSGRGEMTHQVTVVEIETESGRCRCVQDAYFNVTYIDATTNEPLDYFEMLERLAAARHDSIRIAESEFRQIPTWPATIISKADLNGFQPAWFARASFTALESHYSTQWLQDGSLKLTSPRTYDKFVNAHCRAEDGSPQWYLKWVSDLGHPVEMVYLFLYPFHVYGPGHTSFLDRAHQISTPARYPTAVRAF